MTIRGPGRPWGEKLRAKEKRTVLIGLRITPEDAKRLKVILEAFDEGEKLTASTYAARALLKEMARDERRLAARRRRATTP